MTGKVYRHDVRLHLKFCPEVSYDRFGWFASHLACHVDKLDVDVAHTRLAKEGAEPGDWRWTWALVTPLHYSECPLYSPLMLGIAEAKKAPIGFVPDP